ncbi:MAG TPA: hypothetical protein VHA75_00375, partial [Rugosimonospora sp.]|nr:hypothetical protein [Rugosimonospora sp.]
MAVLTRFPVTTLTAAPYLLVIVPMAVWNHNEQTPFVLRLLALALASTAVVEGLARCGGDRGAGWEARLRAANSGYPRLWLVARIVAGVSVVADVVGAYAGRGTVVTQLSGQVASSPAAGLSALVSGWSYLAFGLIVAAYWAGAATRRGLWLWTAILVAAQVYVASLTAILAPLIGYLSLIVAVGALFGLIRARHIAVLIAVVFLLWPTIFEVRNEIRRTEGVAVAQDQTATHRLRFDLQLSAASGYDVPVALGQPGFAAILRYGAVPRVLDPGRPAIATSSDINRYIGGDPNSSYSFLALGTVYFLSGPGGVVLYYAGWAVAVLVLLRWRG